MPKRREFVGLSKQEFSTVKTQLNEEVYGKENEDLRDTRERASNVGLSSVDEGEKVALEMDRSERQQVQRGLDRERRQYSDMLDSGQEENIFGDVRRQKGNVEKARVGLTGSTNTGLEFGDFTVAEDDYEQASDVNQARSDRSRSQDASKRATVTNDFSQWQSNPSQYDYPGVDTPTTNPEKKEGDIERSPSDLFF